MNQIESGWQQRLKWNNVPILYYWSQIQIRLLDSHKNKVEMMLVIQMFNLNELNVQLFLKLSWNKWNVVPEANLCSFLSPFGFWLWTAANCIAGIKLSKGQLVQI